MACDCSAKEDVSRSISSNLLVQYSDSSGSEEDEDDTTKDANCEQSRQHLKRKLDVDSSTDLPNQRPCLALPPAVLAMFGGDATPAKDDPLQHQGRLRSFAHERGNWATYVYIPIEIDPRMQLLISSLLGVVSTCGDWHQMDDLHLSVSRTVVLRHHWIDSLMGGLRQGMAVLPNFFCDLASVELYTNDDQTRTFIGLRTHSGERELCRIVDVVDDCLAEFRLPAYYKDPSFHVSIGWALGDVTGKVTPAIRVRLEEMLTDTIGDHPQLGLLDVHELRAKSGNKTYTFPLKTTR